MFTYSPLLLLGQLVLGLTSPIITMAKLVFFENTFSVLSGKMQLLSEGKIFLFVTAGTVSLTDELFAADQGKDSVS